MKTTFIKLSLAITLICSSVSLMNSCKKMERNQTEFNPEVALKQFKEEVSKKGLTIITPLNKKLNEVVYTDKNGVGTTISLNPISNLTSFGPCSGEFENCTNAGGDITLLETPEVELTYGTRVKYCGNAANNSDVEIVWNVSVPYNFVAQNQLSPFQLSSGRLRFKNSQNQVIQNFNGIPVTFTNLGIDPDCSNRTIFELKYSQTGLSNSLFENGNSMETYFIVFTDCNDIANAFSPVSYVPVIVPTVSGSQGLPCTRTDKVFISTPSSGGAFSQALGVGNIIGCSFPLGWVYPNVQYVEYWQNSSPSTVYSYSISPFAFYNMTQVTYGSGAWTIRYRNQMTSPACNGPWYYEYYTF